MDKKSYTINNKNIKKNRKHLKNTGRSCIAAIMVLCIIFGVVGTCVYAASVMPEETTQEFMPMMARACAFVGYQEFPIKLLIAVLWQMVLAHGYDRIDAGWM